MRPEERALDARLSQRTEPAQPGFSTTTFPRDVQRSPLPATRRGEGRAAFLLLFLGIVLELTYVVLYPLLAVITNVGTTAKQSSISTVQQALPTLFPWLPNLYWTTVLPALPRLLATAPPLNLLDGATQNTAALLLALILLSFAGILVLLAARVGNLTPHTLSSPVKSRLWLLLLLTLLFGVTMVLAPTSLNSFSQDMLAYGLYGRMIAVHHINPYSVAPTAFPTDPVQALLGLSTTTSYSPVWLDISMGLSLFSGESIANILLNFRLLGLLAHLTNTILLWAIVARFKPQLRLSLTLLYAWNPLFLLSGIAYMHQEIVLVTIALLAIFFFQRNSPTIGWVFVVLTALMNLLWLPLLAIFLRYMLHESRVLRATQRLLWWGGMLVTTAIVILLAYAPYWQSLGFSGLGSLLYTTFLPATAINSLDASLLHLPIASHVQWIIAPHRWSLLTLGIATFFLLLGILLADTLELVLLFSSWILLTLVFLSPVYWPWYALGPVAIALSSTHRRTILLAILLTAGAVASYYALLRTSWTGLALVTIGVPLILWGWILFFSATWQMMSERIERERVTSRTSRQVRRSSGWSRPPRG